MKDEVLLMEVDKAMLKKRRIVSEIRKCLLLVIGLVSMLFVVRLGIVSRLVKGIDEAVVKKHEATENIKAASEGCQRKKSYYEPGRTVSVVVEEEYNLTYLVYVPTSFRGKPLPVVISHGGWGLTATEDARDSGLSWAAEKYGFIAVYVQGYADNFVAKHPDEPWFSFNTIGTTGSTAQNPTCETWAGSTNYCYDSCKARAQGCDSRGCDWTTCLDSLGAVDYILNDIEEKTCVDISREYATGQSNGGIFSMRLGTEFSNRFAAIAPVSATFTYGFTSGPIYPLPIFDIVGSQDHTVPVNATKNQSYAISSDGWRYQPLDTVFTTWAHSNRCPSNAPSTLHYPTPFDSTYGLYCFGYLCDAAPAIRCVWDGAHTYFGHRQPQLHAELIWHLLAPYVNPIHTGRGAITTDKSLITKSRKQLPAAILEPTSTTPNIMATNTVEYQIDQTSIASYYTNPFLSPCRSEESLLSFSYGNRKASICAPHIERCVSPGAVNAENGCPMQDDQKQVCLALSTTATTTTTIIEKGSTPALGSDFHCLLACDLYSVSSCPSGAICILGHLRTANLGICLYEENHQGGFQEKV